MVQGIRAQELDPHRRHLAEANLLIVQARARIERQHLLLETFDTDERARKTKDALVKSEKTLKGMLRGRTLILEDHRFKGLSVVTGAARKPPSDQPVSLYAVGAGPYVGLGTIRRGLPCARGDFLVRDGLVGKLGWLGITGTPSAAADRCRCFRGL